MTFEFGRNSVPRHGLTGSSLGQKASRTKIKSMIASDWNRLRGELNATQSGAKKVTPQMNNQAVLDRLTETSQPIPDSSAGSPPQT